MTYEISNEDHQQDLIFEGLIGEAVQKKDFLRILHIWNLAGVCGRLARYIDARARSGRTTQVSLMLRDSHQGG